MVCQLSTNLANNGCQCSLVKIPLDCMNFTRHATLQHVLLLGWVEGSRWLMLRSDKEHKLLLSVRHTTKTLILSSGPEQLHIPCGSQWLVEAPSGCYWDQLTYTEMAVFRTGGTVERLNWKGNLTTTLTLTLTLKSLLSFLEQFPDPVC